MVFKFFLALRKICKKWGLALSVLYGLLVSTLSFSQNIHPVYRNYSIREGLPSSEIYMAIQDSKGYIWLGTDNGVSRFDGYEFKNYSLRDGLSDNTVFRIVEDVQGRIWFGTHSCKLSYFLNDSIYHFKYNQVLADTLPKNTIISSFYVDSNGSVYLGTFIDGCFKISDKGKIEHFNPSMRPYPEDGRFHAREVESNLLGYASSDLPPDQTSQKNSIVFSPANKTLKTVVDSDMDIFTRGNICALRSKDKNSYLSYSNRLITVTGHFEESVKKHPKEIIYLYEDLHQNIWLGYYQGGAGTLSTAYPTAAFSFLENLSVSSILQDREGGYWFTTLEEGLFYVPDISVQQFPARADPGNKPANVLFGNDKAIFIGLQDGSIYSISAENYQPAGKIKISDSNSFQALDFLFQPPSTLWVGTVGGLSTIYRKQKLENLEVVPLPSNRLVFDGQSIWGANFTGLYRFEGQSLKYMSISSGMAVRANCLFPTGPGNFWVGSLNGLWKFSSEKYQYQGNKHVLLQYEINDIENSEHGLLLGTEGAGLVIMKEDSIYSIGEKQGLRSNGINSIFVDGSGTVWLATRKGVNSILFKENTYTVQSLIDKCGLLEQEVNDVKINGRDVLIAGKTGFKIVRDYKNEKPTCHPPVYITEVHINNHDTLMLPSYDLPYYQNSVRISYKGISYRKSRMLEYRYRMLGLDSLWQSTPNLSVQYPALPPGTYSFEVAVAGNPENKIASIGFMIHPPYWKTWWFIAGIALSLLTMVVSAVYFRIKLVVNKSKLLHELNAAQHKALSSQMNPHFIFNSLNSIHTYILSNKTVESSKYLTKFARLMRMVLENSMENLILVEQEIKALELYLELEAMRFKGKIVYSFEVDESLYQDNIKIPPLLLQPYVENALWHGLMPKEENGTVKIILKKTEATLCCIIEDDGIGRDKSSELNNKKDRKSAGTNITANRINLINSVYRIKIGVSTDDLQDQDGNPGGTRVVVFLPLIS